METSPMETEESVIQNRVEPEVAKPGEIAPVEVCETRAQTPEIEKSLDQPLSTLDVTKLSYEVQQGYRVFVEMSGDSYKNVTWPFLEPVDAEALGLWDYHEKIKEPMSFYQIGCKFNNYGYNSITEVVADIRLILENCYRYNGVNHWVSKLGHKVEKILEQKLALLNRSLRDKVSLEATMALKSDFISVAELGEGTGRRRTAPRNSYSKMINGEDSSSLLTRLKIQEDIEERERRRIREKEKKEANLVLLQDLAEWEEKELGADVMKQLHSLWEIPSLAGLLFLLKDFLFIQDLSITELELGFVYANKSSLLARIYTALLLTPHQRKSLFKKPPMKFKFWESKLCDRMNIWYKAAEKDGQELTCHQYGLDMASFKVLGDVNPLLQKSYMDLSLHQRVWILKCLCDNSLVKDFDFREHLAAIAPTDQRELLLGTDADNWSYMYFPIFSATDLRIYKQCPVDFPNLSKRKKKAEPPPPPPPTMLKAKVTSARPATPTQSRRNARLKKLRNVTTSPDPETSTPPAPPPVQEEEGDQPEPKNTIADGFELVAYDVETLKKLCEQFDEPPLPPKKRGRKPKPPPPRKRCEVELHRTLLSLLEELEKYELSFSKLLSKAKIKIMKESQEPEPEDEPEEVIPAEEEEEWGSEASIGDEIEDAGARNMSSDEDFVLEDEEGRKSKTLTPDTKKDGEQDINKGTIGTTMVVLPQKRKAEEISTPEESKQLVAGCHPKNDNDPCSISIQTAPLKLKKKRKKSIDVKTTSTAVSQAGVTVVRQGSSLSHVPSGLQTVKEARAAIITASTVSSAIKNTVPSSCTKTLTSGGVLVVESKPCTSITQANASTVRIHPKTPFSTNKSSLSTVVKTKTSVAQSASLVQNVTSSLAKTASKNLSSTTTLQSQARLAATLPGIGKVMFVTSSGVPLQVLRAVPVSKQALVQGKTVTSGSTCTNSSSPLQVDSSSSGRSIPLQVVKAASVSQQSLVQGKTLSSVARTSTSNSRLACLVSTSPSLSTGISVPSNATPGTQQPLAQGKTLNTALTGSSNSSPSVCVVSSSTSLSTSTGVTVPMQVLKGLSQPTSVQGKTLNTTTVKSSAESPPLHNVSSTSTPSAPSATLLPVSSSLPVKSSAGGSQMPNSPIHKVVLSAVPTNLANILSTSKQTSNSVTTTASAPSSSVILVPHPATGGVMPLAVKGGTMVLSSPSTSQKVVLIRPPNVLTSSTSSSADLVVSTLGHNIVLSPSINPARQGLSQSDPKTTSVVTANKSLAPVAISPIAVKVSERDTSTVGLGSSLVGTTAPTSLLTTKALTTSITLGSNSTPLIMTAAQSKPTCTTSCVDDQQFAIKGTTLESSSLDRQPSGEELHHIGNSEVSHSGKDVCTSHDTTKMADKQTVITASVDPNLKQINPAKYEESVLPSKTIPSDKSCESGRPPRNGLDIKGKRDLSGKGKDTENCAELSLDLTCYETTVGDSTGCEESDDSAPNGLCQDVQNIGGKVFYGVVSAVTQADNSKENTLDCVGQNHTAEAARTSHGILVTDI